MNSFHVCCLLATDTVRSSSVVAAEWLSPAVRLLRATEPAGLQCSSSRVHSVVYCMYGSLCKSVHYKASAVEDAAVLYSLLLL
jgi:hypothetical protein